MAKARAFLSRPRRARARLRALDFGGLVLGPRRDSRALLAMQAGLSTDELGWQTIRTLCARHKVSAALWVGLCQRDLDARLDASRARELRIAHKLNTRRNEQLREQTLELLRALAKRSLCPVLLKGAATLWTGEFADPGCRAMADLDVLLPAEELDEGLATLDALGYGFDAAEESRLGTAHQFAARLREGAPGPIELHRQVLHARAASLLSATDALACTEELAAGGVTIRVLSPTHRILHNVLHAQLGDRRHRKHSLSLHALHDFAALVTSHRERIDWGEIATRLDAGGRRDVLDAYLLSAERLLGLRRPAAVVREQRAARHFLHSRHKVWRDWDARSSDPEMWKS